ncbi:MAG TPA: MFS transporter [Gemmatimonadales bacterium]
MASSTCRVVPAERYCRPAALPSTICRASPAEPHLPTSPVLRFILGRGLNTLGFQVISVTIGWLLYERTGDPWMLGLVGLVEVIPVVILLVPSGVVADRFRRRDVSIGATLIAMVAAAGLAAAAGRSAATPLWVIYALLALIGVARAFGQPAFSSYFAELTVPATRARMNAWLGAAFETGAIAGPAIAGVLIAWTGGAVVPLVLATATQVIFAALLVGLPAREPHAEPGTLHHASDLLAGFRFIRRNPVFLAAITLDLLAVLLAGAVALLPVYAKDILQVGPAGLGWLRTAASIGALLMSIAVTRLPPFRAPGKVLLWVVAGFGLATVGFGLSRNFAFSMGCLMLVGALDMVSVVIRLTLEQNITPDPLRGRVSAINFLFVGFSNELGAFESGAVAALIGPVATVVAGGVGAIAVVLIVAKLWPELARVGPLHELEPGGSGR